MKKIIYVKETEEACNITKRMLLRVKNFLNIIQIGDNGICYLPTLKEDKFSEYKIKKLTNKINILLEENGVNSLVLSEYLNENQLLKNYLYSKNIHILDGRFLFKCLIYEMIEYIFKIKNQEKKFRRSFFFNK